ncbi:MAG: aminotransferase class V-fold PLP-dependent enzyme, partial [Nitrospira sp.]
NIEHPAVLEVFDEIERRGGKVTKVSVNEDGVVRPRDILEAITENTVLVSVMYANNEIGTIQPVREIAKIIKEYKLKNNLNKPYFHTDACQAGLYLSLDTQKLGVDLLTLDGIKIYGPRSSGLLFVKNGTEIKPIMFGGGQEKGLRSGTENLTSVLGLSQAIEIAEKMRESESERLKNIRDYAIENILKTFPKATLNGSVENRLPNNINICFPNLDAEFAVISLDVSGFAVSYSSSCRNLKEDSSSYVVEALGKTNCSQSSLRITLGRESRKSDIDNFIVALKKIVLS